MVNSRLGDIGEEFTLSQDECIGRLSQNRHITPHPIGAVGIGIKGISDGWEITDKLGVVVAGIHGGANGLLLEIVDAGGLAGFGFGGREGRQKQGGEDGDDGNDDEQLNQGKAGRAGGKNHAGWGERPVRMEMGRVAGHNVLPFDSR